MKQWQRNALWWLACVPIVVFSVGPLYYAFVTSIGHGAQALEPHLLPTTWSLENYLAVFREQPFGWSIFNSLAIAAAAVGVALLLGMIAAYALGRLQFRGRGLLLVSFLSISMFPQIAMLSGLFELIRALGSVQLAHRAHAVLSGVDLPVHRVAAHDIHA